jgi:hypothetical protein
MKYAIVLVTILFGACTIIGTPKVVTVCEKTFTGWICDAVNK